ncbi:MAG TPA: NUDIX domain-containing protein [Gaiellaceae bacterium]|nr:NUDIX domain-containing protein [Gaiellaceae bacterium]
MSVLDGWKFCPRCAAEVELDAEEGRVDCPSCGFRAYANSEPTASALCVDAQGRALLARRAGGPFEGCWDLPGGFLNEGEHPLDGVRRELKEETGVEIEPLDFLGVWMDRYSEDASGPATLNFYWTARIVEGEPEPEDDVAELRWFALDEIPQDELAFRHLPDVISTWQQR